jgi:hypothetical protein
MRSSRTAGTSRADATISPERGKGADGTAFEISVPRDGGINDLLRDAAQGRFDAPQPEVHRLQRLESPRQAQGTAAYPPARGMDLERRTHTRGNRPA